MIKHACFENKETGIIWSSSYVDRYEGNNIVGWELYSELLHQTREILDKDDYNKLDNINVENYIEVSPNIEFVRTFIPYPDSEALTNSDMVYISSTDFNGVLDKKDFVEKINCYNQWIFTNDKDIDIEDIDSDNYDSSKMKVIFNSPDDAEQFLRDEDIMDDYKFAIDEDGEVYTREEFIKKYTCLTLKGEKMIVNEEEYDSTYQDFIPVILLRDNYLTNEVIEKYWWSGEEVIKTINSELALINSNVNVNY